MNDRNEETEMVVAIPSRGLAAKFHYNGGRFGRRPVLAFDDQGFALVVDMRAGKLVRAVDDPVFVGLEPAPAAQGRRTPDPIGRRLPSLDMDIEGGTE